MSIVYSAKGRTQRTVSFGWNIPSRAMPSSAVSTRLMPRPKRSTRVIGWPPRFSSTLSTILPELSNL
jgi:hypothetical protein